MYQLLKRLALRVATVFITVSIAVLVAVQPAQADYLIQNAKVDNIQNTSSNGDNFAIAVSDGEGLCNNKVIIFPTSGVVNSEAHYRAYLTALSAMNSGAKIDVYDYSGSACENGGQISITKPVITLQVAQLQTDQKITEAKDSSSSGAISAQSSGANTQSQKANETVQPGGQGIAEGGASGSISERTQSQKANGTVQPGGQGIAEGGASESDFYGAGLTHPPFFPPPGAAGRNGGRFGDWGAQQNFAGAGQAGAGGRNGGRFGDWGAQQNFAGAGQAGAGGRNGGRFGDWGAQQNFAGAGQAGAGGRNGGRFGSGGAPRQFGEDRSAEAGEYPGDAPSRLEEQSGATSDSESDDSTEFPANWSQKGRHYCQ